MTPEFQKVRKKTMGKKYILNNKVTTNRIITGLQALIIVNQSQSNWRRAMCLLAFRESI